MKKLAVIWLIVATIIAATTTILQIEPAATIIRLSVSSDGSFMLILPLGITFILCVLPLFPIMLIDNFIQNKKNKMPSDLTGKTGIVVKREKEITNAALMYGVFINDQQRLKVGMGRSVFIELLPGTYSLRTKLSNKIYSPELSIQIESGKILAFQTKMDINKSLTTLIPKGEMLFLVQIPYSN